MHADLTWQPRLKTAEQKIARALEKHRLELEMKYKNEAEALLGRTEEAPDKHEFR